MTWPWRLFASQSIAQIYGVVCTVAVLGLIVLTPPFQVYDEPQHFDRAYQLSTLTFRALVENGRVGALVPASLADMNRRFAGVSFVDETTRMPVAPHPLKDTIAAFSRPLDPERTEFVEIMVVAAYSPIAYAPAAIAIAAGRSWGFGPLGLLYMARLANAAVAIGLMCIALRAAPIGRAPMAVFGLLPSTLALFASASPDAGLISSAYLFTAVALQARARGSWTRGAIALATAAATVFCSLKPVYAPLLVLALPFGLLHSGSRGNSLRAHAVILVIALGITFSWLTYAKSTVVVLPGRDPARALEAIADPVSFARFVYYSFVFFGAEWGRGLIGIMGYGSIHLPVFMYALPLACLGYSFLGPRPTVFTLSRLELVWGCVLIVSSILFIMIALYMFWAIYPSNKAYGVQGRYFLPLTALAAAMLASLVPPRWARAEWSKALVAITMSVEAVLAWIVIATAFEVF